MNTKLKDAFRWLNHRCKNALPLVDLDTQGCAYFSGYLFKIKREGKPSVWYLVKLEEDYKITSIKRICTY
jgi:hypothetical protein